MIYAFVSAGAVLILMNMLLILRRGKKGWNWLSIAQVATNIIFGLGLALCALLALNDSDATNFMVSPWVLPMLCLVFFSVLVLNHLPKLLLLFPRLGSRLRT